MAARVLIVDPELALLEAYRKCLSREGFEVATTTSGPGCVAQLKAFAVDVLVLATIGGNVTRSAYFTPSRYR